MIILLERHCPRRPVPAPLAVIGIFFKKQY